MYDLTLFYEGVKYAFCFSIPQIPEIF